VSARAGVRVKAADKGQGQARARGKGTAPERRRLDAWSQPVQTVLQNPGAPLESPLRKDMESRFQHDFSRVRIHTGSQADASARAVRAQAYALGDHVVFSAGRYAPGTPNGRWLLAHELAHVAQARPGGRDTPPAMVEGEASRAATAALARQRVQLHQHHSGQRLHRFGQPQHVPQFTYIAGQDPRNDGFLNDARLYHRYWGLRPRLINSLEDIINHLQAGAGRINRIRIVTHASQQNLYTALFDGGSSGILEDTLRAFSESDARGLSQILGRLVNQATVTLVMGQLRQGNAAVLRPFNLDQSGSPAGALAELVQRSAELRMYQTSPADPQGQAQRNDILAALRTVLADLRNRVVQQFSASGVTAAQVQGLQNAITNLAAVQFNQNLPVQSAGYMADIRAANRATGGRFRRNLNRVRARFSNDSWIDIRGCRVGGNLNYLRAVAGFFGAPGNLPHVSGPEWFQSFPTLGYRTLAEADIPTQARQADVQRALDHWSAITGVRRQMDRMRSFYLSILIQAASSAAAVGAQAPGPNLALQLPPLLGGLTAPTLAAPILGAPTLPNLPPLQLPSPSMAPPSAAGPSLGAPQLRNPLVSFAQQRLDALNAPGAELRFYLDSALVLPVQAARNVEDIRLYMKHDLRNRAIDNWLASQWAPAAPGLRALQRGSWSSPRARKVAALTKKRGGGAVQNQEMYVSPDPRYHDHIKSV
jgi:hypothetical protein